MSVLRKNNINLFTICLVDLRHVVDDQIIEVQYENRLRRFKVLSDQAGSQESQISSMLKDMSLSHRKQSNKENSASLPLAQKISWNTKVDMQELSDQAVCNLLY